MNDKVNTNSYNVVPVATMQYHGQRILITMHYLYTSYVAPVNTMLLPMDTM